MDLNQFITKYNGKVVADGQCGNLVRAYWNEVDKTSPPSYPNSKDYWFNSVPGYERVSVPQPGDIAIYNGHGAYPEGHSAIYVDGRVFEQNADPDGSPAHLYNRQSPYLLGYLHKQSIIKPGEETMVDRGGLETIWTGFLDRKPTDAEYKEYVGKDWPTVLFTAITSQEYKNRYAKLVEYYGAWKREQDGGANQAQTKLDQIKKIVS